MATATAKGNLPVAIEDADNTDQWLVEITDLTDEQIRNRTKDLENNISLMRKE